MRQRAHGFFLEALQLDPRRARPPRQDRDRASLDREPRRRARELRPRARARRRASRCCARRSTPRSRPATRRARSQWGNDLLGQRSRRRPRARRPRRRDDSPRQPEAARALLEVAAARDDVDAHVALARLALPTDPAARRDRPPSPRCASRRTTRARARSSTEARGAALGDPGPEIADLARVRRADRREPRASSATSSARSRAPPRTSTSRCSSP